MLNKILLCGATGRMGKEIESYLMHDQTDLALDSKFSRKSSEELSDLLMKIDLIIDFSLPELTEKLLDTMIQNKIYKPLVIGTSGFTNKHFEKIKLLSQEMPILQDTNMSPGIHFLNAMILKAPQYFDESYDIDLYDRHHRNKIDAPSGTLKKLLSTLEGAYDYQNTAYTPNSNLREKRPAQRIGVSVERSGNVFADHRVSFVSENEEIQLNHRAFNRKLFAKGAVMALNWLKNQPAGRYSMSNIFK